MDKNKLKRCNDLSSKIDDLERMEKEFNLWGFKLESYQHGLFITYSKINTKLKINEEEASYIKEIVEGTIKRELGKLKQEFQDL